MTRQEFSKLTDEEAAAYLLVELQSIASAEALANKELESAVGGILLPKIADRMLKIFRSKEGGDS